MAYLPQDENQEQQQNQQQDDSSATQEKVLGGESAAAPTTGNTAAPNAVAGSQPKATKSGSFTNLMNYVGANAGNDAKMGQAVNNAVKTQADTAQTKTNEWAGKANQQVAANTVQQDTQLQQNLVNDPTKVNKEQLNAQVTARYDGPQRADDVEGYTDVRQAYNQVDNRVQQAGGDLNQRTGLLDEVYNRPTYTGGEKRLDSFILGTGEGGKAQLKNIQDTYGNFRSNFDNASTNVNQQIGTGRDTTVATAKAAQDAVGAAKNKYQSILELASTTSATDNAARNKEFGDEVSRLTNNFASGDRDSQVEELVRLGLSSEDAINTVQYGTAQDIFRNFYTYGGDKTAADYVSPEQQAQYAALMDLIGGQVDFNFNRSGVSDPALVRNTPAIDALIAKSRSNKDVVQTKLRAAEEASADAKRRADLEAAFAAKKRQREINEEAAKNYKNGGTVPVGNDDSKVVNDSIDAVVDPMEHAKQRTSDINKAIRNPRKIFG